MVGSPIAHSLSPVLHRAAYKYLELDYFYEAHEVGQGKLAQFLESSHFEGVSVTMPIKSEAFNLAASHTEQATLTGAANTLTRTPNGWHASNTDIYGLTQALSSIPLPSSTAILGAGATTSSALAALAELFPATRITVMARDEMASKRSVEFGLSLGLDVSGSAVSSEAIINSDLVLSLVPAGSFVDTWSEVSNAQAAKNGWLFDASYNPWPSMPATSWGNDRVISGLEMLIWQAIEQVAQFASSGGKDIELERPAVYEVMKRALSNN